MTALALTSFSTAPAVREGSPRRAAILTALASAAVRQGNLRAVLILARTGRPRSLIRCRGDFRWLALAGLTALYPEANIEILRAALGCRLTDKRLHEPARYAARVAAREAWPAEEVAAIAQDVAEHEDHELTARWIWPTACAVAAAQTGVDPRRCAWSPAREPRNHEGSGWRGNTPSI